MTDAIVITLIICITVATCCFRICSAIGQVAKARTVMMLSQMASPVVYEEEQEEAEGND